MHRLLFVKAQPPLVILQTLNQTTTATTTTTDLRACVPLVGVILVERTQKDSESQIVGRAQLCKIASCWSHKNKSFMVKNVYTRDSFYYIFSEAITVN